MANLRERFADVIRMNTSETRRWKELETLTGIPAANWLAAVRNKQRPTAEMIEALARAWPQYAFWMVTGTTDARYGHVSADTYGQLDGDGRPVYPEVAHNATASTAAYLKLNVKLYVAKYELTPHLPPEDLHILENRHAQLDLERLSQIQAVAEIEKRHLQETISRTNRHLTSSDNTPTS